MRPWSFGSPRSIWITAGLLAVLLAVLAVLQYRWIGEVSQADRDRRRASLTAAADRFADDLGREVTRAFFTFQPWLARPGDPGAEPGLAERWRRWRQTAPQPDLVSAVYTVSRDAAGSFSLARVDPATDRETPVDWPAELLPIRRRLEEPAAGPGGRGQPMPFPLVAEVPALIVPLHQMFGGERERAAQGGAIVVLSRKLLADEVFPELAERCFGVSRAPDFLIAVKGPGGLVYRSDASLPDARYLPGDLTMPLLTLHRGDRHFGRERPPEGGSRGGVPPNPPDRRFETRSDRRAGRGGYDTPWRLVISHREGSLEAAVEKVRRRNLAVSVGVLALLAATFAVLAVSAQRARALARQQIEFVAGVTHELNTPLAAVRSAGQNLADGVVADAQQVKRYGSLIEREGRRLSGMVSKALELAGIQSGAKTYRPEPLALAEVVDEVLAELRWVLDESGVRVERDLPADLPPANADRAALRMAVHNLVDNAVKYAGAAGWIGIRARSGRDGREVSLIVEDRGPGIRPEDRPHLFDPFYRGRDVSTGTTGAAGAVHGSGLGLSLVRHAIEAQRGSLSVATGPGGSAFTIRLPAAPARAIPAAASASPASSAVVAPEAD